MVNYGDYADSLVLRAMEIIRYFNPRAWFLESPATSLLKTRLNMHLIPCVTVSYCKYGAGYQKHTMLWGTAMHHRWRPRCQRDCETIINARYKEWAQRGGQGARKNDHTQVQLYSMPKALCLDIARAALNILDTLEPNELYI